MKHLNLTKTVLLLCIAFFFFACNDEGDLPLDYSAGQELMQTISASIDDETFISSERALEVADVFFNKQTDGTTLRSGSLHQSQVSVETIKDGNKPSMHIINNPKGGWVIVSATRDYYPILAYSDEGSFEIIPEMNGVTAWLEETKEAITLSASLDDKAKKDVRAIWKTYETANMNDSDGVKLRRIDPYDAMMTRIYQIYNQYPGYYPLTLLEAQGDFEDQSQWQYYMGLAAMYGSPPEYTIVAPIYSDDTDLLKGPLLTTQWHQNDPFNYQIPNLYAAGCVAIAVAQIMKYHQYPTSFDWSNMPDLSSVTNTSTHSTPAFIRHVGDAVLTDYSTGLSNIDKARNALLNTYNYSSVTLATTHNPIQVRNELLANRPVFMSGVTSTQAGHAWVCHGVKDVAARNKMFIEFQVNNGGGNYSYSTYNVTSVNNPVTISESQYTYYCMNWGWNQYNGWFIQNNVNTNKGNYSENRMNLYIQK